LHPHREPERLPLLEQAQHASHWAGLYEIAPDVHSIFGRTPVDGLFVVSGFSGHGFMHGPVAGKLMAELMLDGAYQSLDVSALDLARFDEGRLIQEYNVV
jgi:sarcosine oxidase subunit beta